MCCAFCHQSTFPRASIVSQELQVCSTRTYGRRTASKSGMRLRQMLTAFFWFCMFRGAVGAMLNEDCFCAVQPNRIHDRYCGGENVQTRDHLISQRRAFVIICHAQEKMRSTHLFLPLGRTRLYFFIALGRESCSSLTVSARDFVIGMLQVN